VTRWKPGISFLRVEPAVYEPQWAGEIDGEVQNDNPTKTIQFVQLYGVVFDAGGNILGGGTGFGFATLPPAARMVLRITDGHAIDPVREGRVGAGRRPCHVQDLLGSEKMRLCDGRSQNDCSTSSSRHSSSSCSRLSSHSS
jgi:hypothetical protein